MTDLRLYPFSSLLRRSAAVAILIAVGGTLWGGLVAPLAEELDRGAVEIEQLRDQARRYEAAAARLPAVRRLVAATEQAFAVQPGFATDATPSVAAARLQAELKQLVEANGGTMRLAQELPGTAEQSFSRVGVRVEFLLPSGKLQSVLHAVTARSPFVFLEHVQIRSQESWQQQPGSRAAELPIVVGLQAANYLASRSGR